MTDPGPQCGPASVRQIEAQMKQMRRELASSDMATREICKHCNEDNPVGFDVPDEVWLAAVPPEYANRVLCLQCFAKFADDRRIAWDKNIKLYPVSLATHMAG